MILVSFKMRWFGIDQVGLDPHIKQWITSQGERDLSTWEWIVGFAALAFLVIMIFPWIWLWMLKPYSRVLYTATVLLGFTFYPLGGPYVSNGWPELLDGLASVVTAMILCALYFTEVYLKNSLAEQAAPSNH